MTDTQSSELAFGLDAPLVEIMSTMRAMRRLKPDPVADELLETLVEAATLGPSGGNNQAFSFVVVTDPDQMAALAPLWQRMVRWYVSSQTAPPHMDPAAWERLLATLQHQADNFAQTPALVVACYESRGILERMKRTPARQSRSLLKLGPRRTAAMVRNTQRVMITGEAASIYPGVQNLLLTARALGLGATMTTWHSVAEDEFKAVLGIPSHVNIYTIVPVGWPTGRFGPVRRRPADQAMHRDTWGVPWKPPTPHRGHEAERSLTDIEATT